MKVRSTNIADINYDEKTGTLNITFHGGATYSYLNVPVNVYQALTNAPSKGEYFYHNIKGVFSTLRLN
jgi:hypothetical protein